MPGLTIRSLRTHREAPRLTAPVIVVTAVAISGSAASVVLLCRVRPRPRGPVAAAAGAMLAYAGSDAAGAVAVVAAVATVAFFAWPALGPCWPRRPPWCASSMALLAGWHRDDASDLVQPVATYLRRSATTKIYVPCVQARLASGIGMGRNQGKLPAVDSCG
jgi:hypothetical protein